MQPTDVTAPWFWQRLDVLLVGGGVAGSVHGGNLPAGAINGTGAEMEIVRIGPDDVGRVYEAEDLFDGPIREAAAGRFLRTEGHHLLLAYMAGRPVGMVTGVEMMHPDKGTEMFLYELGVRADARGRGAGLPTRPRVPSASPGRRAS